MSGMNGVLEKIIVNPKPDFEQLLKVLKRCGKPDYVPFYELFLNNEVMEALLGKKMVDRVSTIEFYYKAGYDYVPAWPSLRLELGSLIDTSSNYPISDWESFEKYPWPSVDSIGFQEFESVIPVLPEGMKIIGQYCGVFETVQMLLGYTNLCCMLFDEPDLVDAVFKRVGELYEAMYKGMASIEQVGALVISDDMGFKSQTLMSADDMRKYVLPYHKRLAEIIHAAGKPCILHSCGNLSEIMEDIIEYVGIDAKHSYEDSILPVNKAKEFYGDRIAVLGGVDVDRLCRSSVEDIKAYSAFLVESLGKDGGYALGSGNSIPGYVPVENYLAMLEAGWKLRKEL